MIKEEAKKQLTNLELEVSKLRKIIETPENYLDKITTYEEVCEELNEKYYTLSDVSHFPKYLQNKMLAILRINQIAKLFNDVWVIDWEDTSQCKYRPWFDKQSGGWVFAGSGDYHYCSDGSVVYYKSEKISNYVAKTFINIYKDILN